MHKKDQAGTLAVAPALHEGGGRGTRGAEEGTARMREGGSEKGGKTIHSTDHRAGKDTCICHSAIWGERQCGAHAVLHVTISNLHSCC